MKVKYPSATTTTIINTTTTTVTTATTFTTSPIISNDLLCNSDSEFVCVCQQNAGNLLKHYILCTELIEFDELPVIEMNIRRVNLSARLYTNETYESYFKRRVAATENVVLLSIKPNNLQSTTIGFVITKSQRRSTLSTMTILDSTKVKYVLTAQLAALSRILGGVRIEYVEIAIMEKYRDNNNSETIQRDNFGLLLILSITATFLTITYTIAAVRVCRDCYAKRQAKKNARKLNNAFEMPNYGTCIELKQNEVSRSYETHNAVKAGNDRNNLNPEEMAVMDAYQMRRMFQCDPSQLPAEVPLSPETSTDLLARDASKSLNEPKKTKPTVYQSRNMEEKKNSALSDKINKMSQEKENIIEVPQKNANILAKNEEITERSSYCNSNLTTYFCQSENEFFEQKIKKLPTSISNQPMATCNQPEAIPQLATNLKEPKIDEHLEAVWDQPALQNESIWLADKELRDKSYSLKSLFSEPSFNTKSYNEETIKLDLNQSNQESKRHTETKAVGLKRVSLTDQLNYQQKSESSECFVKDNKPIHFIQKSRTTQFDNWSTESDDEEGDVYHKLSEAEEEEETERNPEPAVISCMAKVKDFTEDPTISQNENYGINLDMQSFTHTKQFKINADEPCYKQLQKSLLSSNSLDLSSTSNKPTPEEFASFSPTDDLK
ncbi:unnamed protein product [Acanthocheilonema viteae]|uniref:Uncharacterized protein n=1 Tax=Acanthocheilonema viteae TaxID=6277 RepID=A0A498S8L8_ACAVI|nr:unnamed protein product [Acanthocheilonema viteae]